jgi:hypothetical protein
MKTLRSILFALAAFVAPFAPLAHAQTLLVPTTLSAAISGAGTQVMTVASVTTVSGYTVVAGTVGYLDNEEVIIKPLNGTVSGTTLGIIRGQGGTTAAPHASGALVFLGPPNAFASTPGINPQGSCTRGNQLYLPFINVKEAVISDCLGGQWTNGVTTRSPRFRIYSPEPGGTAYTSLNTSGTSLIATEVYCTETFVPTNKLLTGAAVLAGTSVSTDSWYMVLYDSGGTALANSAVAGATLSGASTYQQQAFTSKFFAVGPADYFVCFQSNGTSATARMAVTGVNDNILTKGQTGATFGTIPALTVPTTFTTAVGPYVYLY